MMPDWEREIFIKLLISDLKREEDEMEKKI